MAQKRVVSIGNVTFPYKMYVLELDTPKAMRSEVNVSESGLDIVWQAPILTPAITIVSKQQGWITQDVKDDLIAQHALFETTFVLTYDDASTDTVRYAHEKELMKFTPLFEGSDRYTAEMAFAVVII